MNTIYLLRHGEIESQGEKCFVGQKNIPLSEKGMRQARWWEKKLAPIFFDIICCSHLSRCFETAMIISQKRRELLCITPRIGEIHLGEWEGLPMSQVRQRFPEEWEERGKNLVSYRPPGGESFGDLRERVISAFEDILSAPGENGLIIAHAGVNRVILCHVLGMPLANLFRLEQDYSALSKIRYQGGTPRLISMNRRPDIP